jgi:hypothetical protein
MTKADHGDGPADRPLVYDLTDAEIAIVRRRQKESRCVRGDDH